MRGISLAVALAAGLVGCSSSSGTSTDAGGSDLIGVDSGTPGDALPGDTGPQADAPGPDAVGPDVPRPDAAGPDAPGPDTAGPDVPGPDVPGPDAPDPDVPGPDVPVDCVPADCDDSDPCTDDVCVAGNCEHTDNTAGCDDGDPCSEDDACAAGTCAGTPKDCDDQDLCTADSCSDTGDCLNQANPADCEDGNPCTDDSCVAATGSCANVVNVSNPCSDGDPCTNDVCAASGDCESSYPISLAWPLGGEHGPDWVITNFVDLDPGPGIEDFVGGGASYDGHDAIDIVIPSFRQMDDGSAVAYASAPGTVLAIEDGEYDRNVTWDGQTWNFVRIGHADGWTTTYGHLKRYSALVNVGDDVVAGQPIGVVGSSGISDTPHLHWEIWDCQGAEIEPFQLGIIEEPPSYDNPFALMEAIIADGSIYDSRQARDPQPNLTQAIVGQPISFAVWMSGGEAGDAFEIEVTRADGSTWQTLSKTFDQSYRRSGWYFNRTLDSTPGLHTATYRVNGQTVRTETFTVLASPEQFVRLGVPVHYAQEVFDAHTGNGYWVELADGGDVNGAGFLNFVFRSDSAPGGVPAWGITWSDSAASLESAIAGQAGSNRIPVHLDAYVHNDAAAYVAVYRADTGQDIAYDIAVPSAGAQAAFDAHVAAGRVPRSIAEIEVDGARYITSLYEAVEAGTWWAWRGLDFDGLIANDVEYAAAGQSIDKVNASTLSGERYFSATWTTSAATANSGGNVDILAADVDAFVASVTAAGNRVTSLSGYSLGGLLRYTVLAANPD